MRRKSSRIMPYWLSPGCLLAVPCLLMAFGGATSRAQGQVEAPKTAQGTTPSPGSETRGEDRTAIRELMRSLEIAFESGDAQAVAGLWTADGEYVGEDGSSFRGREDLVKAYDGRFSRSPKVGIKMASESVRFLGRDTAIDEGRATVRGGTNAPVVSSRYSALVVREDGRWRVAQLRETGREAVGVGDLAWLVGSWKSGDAETQVETTYEWDGPGRRFLRARFAIKAKDETSGGTQMIGIDPATGELHAWIFGSDGGVGESNWSRDGEQWVIEAIGTLNDGRTMTARNLLTRVNDDTFTWQSTNRMLDDEPIKDLPPTKVTRVKSGK